MESRKTIELTFPDSSENETTNRSFSQTKPEMAVKKLNYGGLLIEIMEPKQKKVVKPVSLCLSLSDENSSVAANHCVVIKKEPLKTKQPKKPQALPKPPVIVKGSQKPVDLKEQEIPQIDDINGAAGLWAQTEAKRLDDEFQNIDGANVLPEPVKCKKDSTENVELVSAENWNAVKSVIFADAQSEMSCYDRLLEMSKSKLHKNQEDFVCSICEEFIFKGDGILLKGCLHNVCRLCIVDEIKTNFDMMGEVKCPFQGDFPCESLVEDQEVKELLGDEYNDFALKVLQSLTEKVQESERAEEAKHDPIALLLLADEDHFKNYEKFKCLICFDEVEIGQGVILKDCWHKFCKYCLIGQIENSEEFEVKCPNNDEGGSCEKNLQEREIKSLVTAESFEKHLEKSLKLYEAAAGAKMYHCKTADCRGFYELVDANVRGFTCEVCLKVNCIGCKTIHQGKNCQEYQDELNPNGKAIRENAESENAIKRMIENDEAMWCPK